MTTYDTGNQLGFSAAKGLYDNAQSFDRLSNDQSSELWPDRFGNSRLTWHGMEIRYRGKPASMGWILTDSFQDGANLTRADEALHWKLLDGNSEHYRWGGILSKNVPAESTPDLTGGTGQGAWVSVGDASLRKSLSSSDGLRLIGDVSPVLKSNDVSGVVGDKVFLESYVENESNGGGFPVAMDNSTLVDNIVISNGDDVKWERSFPNGEVDIYDAGHTGSGDASSFVNSINNHEYDCIVSGRCEFTGVINIDVSKGALKGINKCKFIETGVAPGDYYLQIKNLNTEYEDRDAMNATSAIGGASFVINGSRKMSLGGAGGDELLELRISNCDFISSTGIEFLDNSYRILSDKCITSRSLSNTTIYNSSINSGEVIKYENCWIVDNGGPLSFKNGQFIFDSCNAPVGKETGCFDPTFKLSDNVALSFVNGNIELQPSQFFVAFELSGSSRLNVNDTSVTLTNDYTLVPIICNDDGVVFLSSCLLPLFDIANLSKNTATRQVVGENSRKVMSHGCCSRARFITTQQNKGNIVSPYINSLLNESGQLLSYSNWNLTQTGTGVATAGTDADVPDDLMFLRPIYVTMPSVGVSVNFYQECEECSPGRHFRSSFWVKSQMIAISGIEFFDKERDSVQSKTSFSIPDSATWNFYALVDVAPPGASKARAGFDVLGAIGALHLHNVVYGLIQNFIIMIIVAKIHLFYKEWVFMDKIFFIQILRGIATPLAVCFHFRYAVNDIYAQKDIGNRLFEFGSFGAGLFFIISGFIMAMSVKKNENFSEFFIKRFFRIYPLYFVVLTLYILPNFDECSLPQIIRSYLLVSIDYKSEMPYCDYNIMAIAWTFTYEFWSYFILGISKKLSYKSKFIISSVLLFAPVVFASGINIDAFHANYVLNWGVFNNIQPIINPVVYNFILSIPSFNICVFASKHRELLRLGLSLALPLSLLCGVIDVVSIRGMGHGINQWGRYCFVIATSIVISETYFEDMHASSKMVYLGEISFSIYLIHPLLFILINSYYLFTDVFNSLSGFTRLSCLIAFVTYISHIVYWLTELPTHNLGKKIAGKIKCKGIVSADRYFYLHLLHLVDI